MNVAGDVIDELRDRIKALESALQQITQVLGPAAPTHKYVCSGCAYEIGEALRLCRSVGIKCKQRRPRAAKP